MHVNTNTRTRILYRQYYLFILNFDTRSPSQSRPNCAVGKASLNKARRISRNISSVRRSKLCRRWYISELWVNLVFEKLRRNWGHREKTRWTSSHLLLGGVASRDVRDGEQPQPPSAAPGQPK